MEEIMQLIKRRRWKLIGHVLTKSASENTKIALTPGPRWKTKKRKAHGGMEKNCKERKKRVWV